MAENFIYIKDQADGKAVATTISERRDGNNSMVHIQAHVLSSRLVEIDSASRDACYKDIGRGLVEEMLYYTIANTAGYGIVPHAFTTMCWMSGDNTDSGDDEAYIIGGADNRCHMINLADPMSPQINLDYFPVLPVELDSAMAASCSYSASIYVLGMNGRICSRPVDDTTSAWTLYLIEWGTFTKQCSLVKSRSSSSQNRWFVLERGASKEIMYTSNLNNSIPDEGHEYYPSYYSFNKGALLHWCRYSFRLLLFDIAGRQAYTYETLSENEFKGWQPIGNQFNYDCSEYAVIEEQGDLLTVFTGMYGGSNYSTLNLDDADPLWFSTQPNGYLQNSDFTVFAGSAAGGSPMGDDDYLIFFGGFTGQGPTLDTSLRIMILNVPGIVKDLLDCRDFTKVKCTLFANDVSSATGVTFTPILYDFQKKPIYFFPSITINKPDFPFTSVYGQELWGCTEIDVSGAYWFGVYIENVIPGDELDGDIYLYYGAL